MAQIHTLKKDGKSIYPVTHISAVVDDNGNTVAGLIREVENKVPTKEYVDNLIINTLNTEV